jgi:hypothetical protein
LTKDFQPPQPRFLPKHRIEAASDFIAQAFRAATVFLIP